MVCQVNPEKRPKPDITHPRRFARRREKNLPHQSTPHHKSIPSSDLDLDHICNIQLTRLPIYTTSNRSSQFSNRRNHTLSIKSYEVKDRTACPFLLLRGVKKHDKHERREHALRGLARRRDSHNHHVDDGGKGSLFVWIVLPEGFIAQRQTQRVAERCTAVSSERPC